MLGALEMRDTQVKFETTRWTLIEHLRTDDPAERSRALARLAEIYWPAVYGFLRRRGVARERAEETTQAFFADVVLSRSLFAGAVPDKGRLRSLILAALKRFRIDEHRRSEARGAKVGIKLDVSCIEREERSLRLGKSGDADADLEFDRQWAAAQVEEAVRRCRDHFTSSGRARHWELFERRIVDPSVRFTTPLSLAELAPDLGFSSAADAAAAVQVVKKRFDALLRDVVAETVGDDAETEYRHVIASLA